MHFEGVFPFLELGRTAGVDAVTLTALNDGVSDTIDIPFGFAFGNSTQADVYVSQDYCASHNLVVHNLLVAGL